MRVVLGGVDIEKDEAFDQTIDVEKAIIHEKYREETFALYNDIGGSGHSNSPPFSSPHLRWNTLCFLSRAKRT